MDNRTHPKRFDRTFWIVLIVILIVAMLFIFMYIIGQMKKPAVQSVVQPSLPPPKCDKPGPNGDIEAFVIPGYGTRVQWNEVYGATIYSVYCGDMALTSTLYEMKVKTSETFIDYPDMYDMSNYFMVCPENNCGSGACSPVTKVVTLV